MGSPRATKQDLQLGCLLHSFGLNRDPGGPDRGHTLLSPLLLPRRPPPRRAHRRLFVPDGPPVLPLPSLLGPVDNSLHAFVHGNQQRPALFSHHLRAFQRHRRALRPDQRVLEVLAVLPQSLDVVDRGAHGRDAGRCCRCAL